MKLTEESKNKNKEEITDQYHKFLAQFETSSQAMKSQMDELNSRCKTIEQSYETFVTQSKSETNSTIYREVDKVKEEFQNIQNKLNK